VSPKPSICRTQTQIFIGALRTPVPCWGGNKDEINHENTTIAPCPSPLGCRVSLGSGFVFGNIRRFHLQNGTVAQNKPANEFVGIVVGDQHSGSICPTSTNHDWAPNGGIEVRVDGVGNAHNCRRTLKTRLRCRLLSGGVAGTISSVITNPLEVIKTQLQASGSSGRNPVTVAKQIITQDGLSGFFRGLPPTLVGIIPARSVYFYSYQTCKKALGPYFTEGSPTNALVSGFLAGICSNTLTNPIWMVRTRMQILPSVGQKTYAGYGDAIGSIWAQEGFKGFYKGIFASYWGCTEGALQFIVYEQIKTRLLQRENVRRKAARLPTTDQLSKQSYFWAAALAKGIASVATYPHEVVRTRLREQATSGVFRYSGMWQSIALIAKEEGRAGLYSGMGIHLVKVVPNSALMFLTYELVHAWLDKINVLDSK
jgi:solute carrier family 25, member 33/36